MNDSSVENIDTIMMSRVVSRWLLYKKRVACVRFDFDPSMPLAARAKLTAVSASMGKRPALECATRVAATAAGMPCQWVELMQKCWAQRPSDRYIFAAAVSSLKVMRRLVKKHNGLRLQPEPDASQETSLGSSEGALGAVSGDKDLTTPQHSFASTENMGTRSTSSFVSAASVSKITSIQ